MTICETIICEVISSLFAGIILHFIDKKTQK